MCIKFCWNEPFFISRFELHRIGVLFGLLTGSQEKLLSIFKMFVSWGCCKACFTPCSFCVDIFERESTWGNVWIDVNRINSIWFINYILSLELIIQIVVYLTQINFYMRFNGRMITNYGGPNCQTRREKFHCKQKVHSFHWFFILCTSLQGKFFVPLSIFLI